MTKQQRRAHDWKTLVNFSWAYEQRYYAATLKQLKAICERLQIKVTGRRKIDYFKALAISNVIWIARKFEITAWEDSGNGRCVQEWVR